MALRSCNSVAGRSPLCMIAMLLFTALLLSFARTTQAKKRTSFMRTASIDRNDIRMKHQHPSVFGNGGCHTSKENDAKKRGVIAFRSGAGRGASNARVKATSGGWKKTPLGFPVLLPRSAYPYLDIFATVVLAYLVGTNMIEGPARTLYGTITTIHFVIMVLTDYNNDGQSWLSKATNGLCSVALPLSIMYLYDTLVGVVDMFVPYMEAYKGGFTNGQSKFIVAYLLGRYSAPGFLFMDYGTANIENKKQDNSPLPTKQKTQSGSMTL